nr:MAG TPA: adenine-specific methyltransferase [Caudoviricetes sp.]
MEFSKQIRTSKSDEYYTPAYAVQVILPFLKARGFKHVWCPFDKEHSEFVKILKEEGFNVTFGHIETGQDFFNYEEAPAGVDCIISNPPFSKRTAIFEELFKFGLPFAMIMNPNGLFDNKARFELFKSNKFELLIPKGRMCFFDESMEVKNNPNFQSIYVCSGILDNQIEFVEMEK